MMILFLVIDRDFRIFPIFLKIFHIFAPLMSYMTLFSQEKQKKIP